MSYVPYKTATQWQQYFAALNDGPSDQIKIAIDTLGATESSQSGGSTNVTLADLPFSTVGLNDVIDFAAFAGTKPIVMFGIVAATGSIEDISLAPGYTISGVNQFDTALLNGTQGVIGSGFNISNKTLVGVGSTISYTSGYFSSLMIIYEP